MNCLVCGKKFGFFTRTFGSDADDGVCKECEENGALRGRLLLDRCGPRSDLSQLRGELEELIGQFPLPELHAKLRRQFVERMAEALAAKEDLRDADVEHFNAVSREYGVSSALAPSGLADSVMTINARMAVAGWERGDPPRRECRGLLLEREEICHWEEPAKLFEQRSRVQYVGGSQGVSIRLARGLYYRVGAFKGERINTPFLADCGAGTLHITDRRLAFTGSQSAVSVPYKKFISVSAFEDGFQVFRTGAKRPTILQVSRPEVTLQLLGTATPAPND